MQKGTFKRLKHRLSESGMPPFQNGFTQYFLSTDLVFNTQESDTSAKNKNDKDIRDVDISLHILFIHCTACNTTPLGVHARAAVTTDTSVVGTVEI